MATASQWIQGARPRTLPNAVAPVVAGVGAALHGTSGWGGISWWKAVLALVVAVAFIIGVNFANDYSDGVRGTDDDRVGPLRLVGAGLASPGSVKAAAFICFGIGAVCGLVLAIATAWWLVVVGAVCIAGAWFYTGGKRPYGYAGWGEVAVFVFFGLVAVLGTQFVTSDRVDLVGLACAVGVGAVSSSVLVVNNLRDIPTDTESGKITLAVRLGDARTRTLFAVLLLTPLMMSAALAFATPWALVELLTFPLLWQAYKPVRTGAQGPGLIPSIGTTGKAMLGWAVVTAVALALT
ncbi:MULTISPECIES: 1,4-dihydroxy-2-naphthoate polyprenyltransferase [Gordonia]|uniref:1,4-dihydroxy-2-naphthoate octaprenyltransferase n=1 Tax=Gordonia amicalis TaxID=89053 RepID=A0AAE4U754_9ACTN|nr:MULTISPECIES: 1,4-dihydroxy-2-naphthoate polyprenyltransferase [Gordonia]ATD69712.1 1,4-dihydroxy-2-naphthoate polyprenyltransferase [Gordonia sp. 1D]MCZ4653788.1 1,4-dihydroxy-2-naphthoate polyprenyltransferase [Gordonia amicalis]MDJ0454900.1 1,4-dihydroxy-2-naphthoate polyprenyltransferase [Gordonia amicalis]MDV6307463.1 1,4-dihydroxy-2-naphthoate polyprenyltransferase [Gordonia amicalis]MDV6314235.1 1,4-dihydroxy-2-naphthoate polyprenyltransferase [Gordonia amicalis]